MIDDVINDLKEYAEDIIPVLDRDNHLLGVITSQDIVELVEDEANEDYSRLAGLIKQESDKEGLFGSIKKRIPWLITLLLLGLIVSSIISAFTEIIAEVTVAVLFQSVVLGMAGNGGTQTLAVTLTSITQDDNLSRSKVLKMLIKEFSIGVLNGLILGIISFGIVLGFLVFTHSPVTNGVYDFIGCLLVSISVSLSLVIALVISSLLGLLLPIFFKKVKIDPAIASGPMITTINDLCSSCIYYGLIGLLFGLLI